MHRIDTPSRQKDKFGAGKDGFTQGDPQTGTQATQVSATFLDSIQEELAAVIEDQDSGLTLDKSKNNQLLTAIKNIIRSAGMLASESLRGVIKIATQQDVEAGTSDSLAVTPKKLRLGFAMKLGSTGYFSFPTWLGSFIFQWGSLMVPTGMAGGIKADITFPIAYPNAVLGIATTSGVSIGNLDTNSEYRLCRQNFSVGIPTQTGVSAQAFVENYVFHSRSFYWISLGR
ncbi:MAG: hypothetical protein RIQ83_524 [Pseudomonadota bacterium]|jgi:hypothetical protein